MGLPNTPTSRPVVFHPHRFCVQTPTTIKQPHQRYSLVAQTRDELGQPVVRVKLHYVPKDRPSPISTIGFGRTSVSLRAEYLDPRIELQLSWHSVLDADSEVS